jgi:hypothetical protein
MNTGKPSCPGDALEAELLALEGMNQRNWKRSVKYTIALIVYSDSHNATVNTVVLGELMLTRWVTPYLNPSS